MRLRTLTLAIALALTILCAAWPAAAADACDPAFTTSVAIAASASGNNEIVALTSTQAIYICDVVLVGAGTVGVQFIYGTGTACATDETDLSGVMTFVAQTVVVARFEGSLKVPRGSAFCIELSTNVAINGVLTYRKGAPIL